MHVITIRLPDDLAEELRAHKRRTDVPVEAFVRRAIRIALAQFSVDDITIEEAAPLGGLKVSPKVLR